MPDTDDHTYSVSYIHAQTARKVATTASGVTLLFAEQQHDVLSSNSKQ